MKAGSARDLRVGVNHLALEQECQRQESTLRRLRQIQSQLSKDILNLNADVLRYLDGISNLEQPISSLTNTICRSAAAISHPDAAPLTVFANKFHHNKNELKAQIQKNVDLAEEKMRLFNPHGTVDEAVRLATELQDQFNHFNQMWEDTRQLSVTSRSLLPLNLRMAEVRGGKVENSQLPQTVMVKVLINIRDSSFQVHKDEELLLVDNSDPIYWTVQTAQGPRQLPSVALSVIGPYSDGVFDMNK
ncbi:unnamed protein product [Schistocephalus solidus]|uniref:SH3_10 domain-containing protein n=1 Tax=Schistocephalus solidus TaxID=70667 RepID=A0A183SEL6_SCHSO|nr:unnamed protein product [Schistocephalus solidus]